MSLGIYNEKYFENHPEEREKEGVLYCVVLVNKSNDKRECIKIGIAKGKDWRHVLKRSIGFKGYDVRIQKTVTGPLMEIYYLEQYLHELWQHKRYQPDKKFAGWTECFELDEEIIRSVPKTV